MTFLFLAFRNVFRAKARSGITIAALFFGVFMSLLLGGLVLGMGESLIDETVNARVGALQVHRKGYFESRDRQPLKLDLPQGGELEAKLRAVPGVVAVTPRLVFSGMITNGSRGTIVMGQAVDVETEAQALPGARKLVEGPALSAAQPRGVAVGRELSRALQLQPGSVAMLQSQGKDGRENALDLEVVATLGGANPLESKRMITLQLAHAQELLGMEGRVTEYVVRVASLEGLDGVAAALSNALGPDYEVHTWSQLRPALKDITQAQRLVLGIICLIFMVIAVVGVANTLLMSVMERTREIGTLLAVGVTRAQVGLLFVLEAAAQALIGGAGGLALAVAIVSALARRGGFDLPMGEGNDPFHLVPTLPAAYALVSVSMACAGSILAALYPATRAARLRPVEALSSH